jgi:predicted unusual protein kinase regulating ubiquinone biosynthesis (AarF/ABC1/UbiB family)
MTNKKPPVSKYKRGYEIGKTATKIIGKTLYNKSSNIFKNDIDSSLSNDKLEKENAKIIFQVLSKLRGTAVKIAQLLANEMEYVPENIRNELEKSYYQIPPINKALVRKILNNNFENYQSQFTEFNLEAFAAASLGQVHKAKIDNTALAIKLQLCCPEISLQIVNKIRRIKWDEKSVTVLPFNKRWFQRSSQVNIQVIRQRKSMI